MSMRTWPCSVREGALPPPEEETKFAYLWNCRAVLDQAVRIILATDSDPPGQALAEELARRLGRDRCWRVRWPTTEDTGEQQGQAELARKDANEVLMKDGHEELHRLVAAAEPYPIRGLFKCVPGRSCEDTCPVASPGAALSSRELHRVVCRISDFFEDILASYAEQDSQEQGVSTGWRGLDPYYRVRTPMALSEQCLQCCRRQLSSPARCAGGPRRAEHCHRRAKFWQVGVDRCPAVQPGRAVRLELCHVLHGKEGTSTCIGAAGQLCMTCTLTCICVYHCLSGWGAFLLWGALSL